MIDIPTVFILGAGASVPYGYSTAAGLEFWGSSGDTILNY